MIKVSTGRAAALGAAALLLAGCGSPAASAHGSHAGGAPRRPAAEPAVDGWRHLNLPSGWDIRGIVGDSGSRVTLVLRQAPTQAHPAGGWATASYNWGTGVVGAVAPASADPASTSATSYRLVDSGGAAAIVGGPAGAAIAWPPSIPTYTSGENPAGNAFAVDNALLGQTGRWLWAALKGPQHATATGFGATWGWRRWDRLVALNRETGRYRVYPIPPDWSASLYAPLWEHPPAFFALASGRGLVALGHWAAVVPAQPGVSALPVRGGSLPTAAEQQQALAVLHQQAWASIDADAAFWNCYVMSDPSAAACPHGRAVFGGTTLSTQPTYYNHGDLGFSLLWAMTLPMETAPRQQSRAADEKLLAAALAHSLLMTWIGSPSAAALRARFHGQPPFRLPGYTRRQGYYWARQAHS